MHKGVSLAFVVSFMLFIADYMCGCLRITIANAIYLIQLQCYVYEVIDVFNIKLLPPKQLKKGLFT